MCIKVMCLALEKLFSLNSKFSIELSYKHEIEIKQKLLPRVFFAIN